MPNLTGQHRWFPVSRKIATPYCIKCGIIGLRNKASQKVVQRPCKDQDRDQD